MHLVSRLYSPVSALFRLSLGPYHVWVADCDCILRRPLRGLPWAVMGLWGHRFRAALFFAASGSLLASGLSTAITTTLSLFVCTSSFTNDWYKSRLKIKVISTALNQRKKLLQPYMYVIFAVILLMLCSNNRRNSYCHALSCWALIHQHI